LNNSVGINSFVKRQTKDSGKTYCKNLSFEDIANHASEQLEKGLFKKGYRDGVVLVSVDKNLIDNFICPIVKINEKTKLIAKQVKRRDEEEPYIQTRALNGTPLKTGGVDLILYRNDVLKETNENETDKNWELISFHAIPLGFKSLPMGPITMMRNQLQLKGGTKGVYSSEQWAESVKFWQEYCFLK
tara:strand:- start:7092 stop:7652 length:561 start_codon:yes stop_codon:yes gene_type:complete